jgi:hypothetical protein
MIWNVLIDLRFNRNQQLKSDDEDCIKSSKITIKTLGVVEEFKEIKKIRHCDFKLRKWIMEHVLLVYI